MRRRSPRSEPRRPRRGRHETPTRRGHTRWLLVTPLVTLAVVIAGVIALEATAPLTDDVDLQVTALPPLAMEEERSCVRRRGDTDVQGIRDDFVRGGRISSTQVAQSPAAFDGLEVGPLVGHRERAGFNTGMSVWLPDGLHEQIEAAGRPGRRGDVILVRGTLHRADPDDGGGTTVRAEELERLADPVEVDDPLHVVQAVVAGLLALGAIGTTVWARIVRRR